MQFRRHADKQTSNFDFVRQARRCIHRHTRHKKTVQANRQLSRESHLCGRYVQDSGLNFHFFVTDACRPETRSQTQRRGKKGNEESVLDMPNEFSAGLEIFSRHQLTTTRRECAFADHMTLSSSSPYRNNILTSQFPYSYSVYKSLACAHLFQRKGTTMKQRVIKAEQHTKL